MLHQEVIDGFVGSEACSRLVDLKPSPDYTEPPWRDQTISFEQLDEPVNSIREDDVCGVDFRKTSKGLLIAHLNVKSLLPKTVKF